MTRISSPSQSPHAQSVDRNVATDDAPRFAILGPLEIAGPDGGRWGVGGRKQRELLSLLVLHRNRAVSAARLAAELWGDEPPKGFEVTLRSHVSHLRRRLTDAATGVPLTTGPAGYTLVVEPGQLDADRFEHLIGLGQEALGLGRPERAAVQVREALRFWRGHPFADLDGVDAAAAEAARLEELRLGALEVLASAELASGRHREVVGELEGFVAAHPYRERFCAQLMVALYRSGRQAEALAAYTQARERLADELGLDPGPELQALAQSVLRQDPLLMGSADDRPPGTSVIRSGGRRPDPRPPDAVFAAAARTRLVGRTSEVAQLDVAWQAVAAGGRRLLLLSGEAGIGKTRLVAGLADRLDGAGHPVLVGRCDAAASPYQPIAAALQASEELNEALADAPEAVLAEIEPLLSGSGGTTDPSGPAPYGAPGIPLYSAVTFILGRLVAAGPVLLVVENAEWIDRASSLLLRHLLERLPAGLLVLVSYRDPPGGRHPPLLDLLGDVAARDLTERIVLGPLSEPEVADLVRDVLPSVDADAARRLSQHTGGNPFFAREVARALADQGQNLDAHLWRVPASVRDVAAPPPAVAVGAGTRRSSGGRAAGGRGRLRSARAGPATP